MQTTFKSSRATTPRCFSTTSLRLATTKTQAKSSDHDQQHNKAVEDKAEEAAQKQTSTHKTQAQLDDELKQKMSGLAGDGGESGVEYEDGQPVSMKRSVKNNMFRYI